MIKIPKASPATASLAGAVSGTLFALIRLSEQTFGKGGLSGLIFLLLGGIILVLFIAFVGGFGQLLKRRGWEPVAEWFLQTFLFLAFAMAAGFLVGSKVMPAIRAGLL